MKQRNRKWRKERLSRGKRDELLRFNFELYGVKELATKAKTNSNLPAFSKPETAPFKYVDTNGFEQTLDLAKVGNLGETKYAESKRLFPNARPCMIDKSGIGYDAEGRENVLGQNLVIVNARRMTKGEYGPWFLLQCSLPSGEEISIPAPGQISNAAIQSLSGIALNDIKDKDGKVIHKAGEVFGPSELPRWARFEFVKDAGQFKNGYFVIMPALPGLIESDE